MLSTQSNALVGEEQLGWMSINRWEVGDAEQGANRPFRKALTPGVSGVRG